MWEHYKKTLRPIQLFVCLITVAIFVLSRSWFAALMFLAAMQIGAVVGAAWGNRLRLKVDKATMFAPKRG